jgi:predicted dithiol-disulfide oxidoreductase (DUF899 family)
LRTADFDFSVGFTEKQQREEGIVYQHVPVARPRPHKGRNETGVWWRRHDEYNKG